MDSESRYELLESLGSGDFATVYRARDTELNREVAIRQMHPQWLAEPKFLDRYWAEAQLLASVQHPHIVTIYDIVRSKGWLVLELMQASLRDRLGGRPMDLRALRTTLIHALKALKYLHSRGIIHGDISPRNLMVDQRKRVKVGDFGIARRLARTDGSVSRGTAKYMAPEALSGEISQVGPTSDLYSLGFSCYELMCGAMFHELFPGLNAEGPQADATWMMWHAAADRRLPPIANVLEGVPRDLATVIEKLIEKNPKDRFQTADEVLAALGDESKGTDRESSTNESATPEAPSQRPRSWVIAMFAVSVLASLGILLIPTGPPIPEKREVSRHGIVRSADLTRGVLELEDQLSGVPEEVPLPTKPKVRLMQLGEAERFIMAREIQPGDWIEVRPPAQPGEEPVFVVSRPLSQSGAITQVDATAGRLTISVESGRLRDDVPMYVPARTVVKLNGEISKLDQARVGDRVEVTHLLDPTGQQGHLVSQLRLLRPVEIAAYLDAVEADGKTLVVTDTIGKPGNRKFTLAEEVTLQFADGQTLLVKDLVQGDRLAIVADESVRSLTVTRGDGSDQGVFLENRDDGTCLIRSDTGNEVLLTITPETDIRLNQSPAQAADLRAQSDRVQVTFHTAQNGDRMAKSIDATRAIKHDRWSLVIGNGTFEHKAVPQLSYAVSDAESLHRTLSQRYAVDPDWNLLLVDRDAESFREEFQKFLPQVTQPMQLIVAVIGQGVLGTDGKAYIAFRDFRWSETATTAIPLESLIDALERCPAEDKILLLDLVHQEQAPEAPQVDLPKLLGSVKLQTLKVIGASAEGERSSAILPEGRRGWFGTQLDLAFGGRADADRNLRVTSAELLSALEAATSNSDSPATQHPFLWTSDEGAEPTPSP